MRVTRKGQVTIPQAIRDAAGMPPGTEMVFSIDDAGRVRLQPSRDAATNELRGS